MANAQERAAAAQRLADAKHIAAVMPGGKFAQRELAAAVSAVVKAAGKK